MNGRANMMLVVAVGVGGGCDDEMVISGTDGAPPPIMAIPPAACMPVSEDSFPSPACVGLPRPVVFPGSADTMEILVGRWTLCEGEFPGPTDEPVVAVQFGADQRWSALHLRDGQLVTTSAPTAAGTFEPIGPDDCCQFFDTMGAPLGLIVGEVGCSPQQLVFANGLYARGPGDDAMIPALGSTPDDHAAQSCSLEPAPVELPVDPDAVMNILAGTWRRCDILPDFEAPGQDDFGLELRPNGDWWRLREQEGRLVRGGHVGDVGQWVVLDYPEGLWLELGRYFGVDLDLVGGDYGGTFTYSDAPRQLRWSANGGPPVVLVGSSD